MVVALLRVTLFYYYMFSSYQIGGGGGGGGGGGNGMEWNKVLGLSPSVLGGSTP